MGNLSGRNYTVTAVTYAIKSQATGERFTVPKAIAEQLGSGDDDRIGLRVVADGSPVFDGDVRLASGTEAYFRVHDSETVGLDGIRPHQDLAVTARRSGTK